MGEKLKIIDLRKSSFLIVILPYIAINMYDLFNSSYSNYSNLVLLLIILLVIEFIFKSLTKIKNTISTILSFLFITLTICFFYGMFIIPPFDYWIMHFFKDVNIRGRNSFFFFFIFIFAIQLIFINKKKYFNTFFNGFCIIFFILNLSINYYTHLSNQHLKNVNQISSRALHLERTDTLQKPVILIIADEYSSPDAIYNVSKDSTVYGFTNGLKNKGWIVKNSFYSFEYSTIHSVSSLFNFNLSFDSSFSKQNFLDIAANTLMNSKLYDSLKKKKIEFINYSIFTLNNSKPLTRLYYYPQNFIELFLYKSIYFSAFYNTGSLDPHDFNNSYYPMENHNKRIINSLVDTLNSIHNKNTFIYVHLLMPHAPFVFTPDFEFKIYNTTENYLAFWHFSNTKLKPLLQELIKENKYRIILTGDHGYRSDQRFNKHNTFAAFWGFNKEKVNLIKSVQDLGFLINNSFN